MDRGKGSGDISVEGGGLIIAAVTRRRCPMPFFLEIEDARAAMPAGFLGISQLLLVTPLIMLDYCRRDYWELFLFTISNQ